MKTVIQIVLTIAIIALGYYCVESINKPIRFQEQHEIRKNANVEKLILTRDAQVAYKSVYNKYTGSFDTLINFILNDSLPLVKKEGSLTDSMREAGMTEIKALALGIISRDTIRVSVKDSLFPAEYPVDSLKYIPFVEGGKMYEMGAGVVETGSGVKVQVFEAKVHNNIYLAGLEAQEIINLNDKTEKLERYPGLKVGSLEAANNNAGNWE
ncbi:hypothetical protein KEM09_05545 [Carboxylicivirga mesophila]|uniref:Uncharacterized protein n=1 Tax=Carboxylicivirga mesophila TaxID=1166478 RepID=A0ABS5K7B4_9BACT|nr:hypothetical protein [Carboxylicivirga mesophila]MBS2210851.1 hypothetical protein [Carboxylicivirga mesophila]